MVQPQVGTVNDDSYGESLNHKLDMMIGNRAHGQLVQIDRANQPLPVEDTNRNVVGRTEQVAPVTTAGGTLVAPANPFRKSILITNITGAQVVYLGFDKVPTSATGHYLHSAAGSSVTIYAKSAIWGLSITAAQTLSVMEEEYDH